VQVTGRAIGKTCGPNAASFGVFLYYCAVSPPGENGPDRDFVLGLSVLPEEHLAQIPPNEERSETRFAGRSWTVYTQPGGVSRRYLTPLDGTNLLTCNYLALTQASLKKYQETAERIVRSIRVKS
jgi:hypothetical protein